MALLELKNIVKNYYLWAETIINVIKWVTLHVEAWEFVSIMWHSGSGKSTLMNIIWLLDTTTTGTYLFEWIDVSHLDSDQHAEIRGKKIGFVFQTYNLIPRKSALEQVMLPLAYQWVSKQERITRATQALQKVWLWHRLHNKPNEMSGWEQQRVSIARALVINPAIILADEPTGALDSKTWDEIMDMLTTLHNEWKTIVLITHEKEIALYAKRHLYLKDGLFIEHTI